MTCLMVEFVGWLRIGGTAGAWQPVVEAPTSAECWRLLGELAVRFRFPDLLVLRAGAEPIGRNRREKSPSA